MDKLKKLIHKREELIKQFRTAQEKESPDINEIDKLGAELRSVMQQIETEEAYLRSTGANPYEPSGVATPPTGEPQGAEVRAAISHYMRTGDRAQLRALTSATGGDSGNGGYLIPEEWERQIIEQERELFVMRQLADVQSSATTVNIPVAVDVGESTWIEEAGAYSESDAEFDTVQLKAHKVGRICRVSEELLADNQYNLESWLTGAFGYSNGLAMEEAYIKGDGVGKPTGFLVDAQKVNASAAALKYEDILNLFKALKSGYFNNAAWLMNAATLVEIMKLKDTSGKYLYSPFEPKTATEPMGQMLGKKIIVSSQLPDIGAGNTPIVLGDFKKYRIHDREGFTILRMNEAFAANGLVGFRGMQRTDGKLLIAEAVQALQMPAASFTP